MPFPLLSLRLKAVPLLSPTGIYNTRRLPSVRHVCDEFDEKPKTVIEFKLNDGNLLPGQISRRVQAAGKCWKRLL